MPPRRSRFLSTALLLAGAFLVRLSLATPTSAANLVFVPLTPCRVIDTSQPGAGGAFAAGETRNYIVHGPTRDYSSTGPNNYGGSATGCGIPGLVGFVANVQNTALALAHNVVAKNASSKGNFQAFATNHPPASAATSTLNFNGIVTQPVNNGMNIANGVVIAMCDQTAASPCVTGDVSVTASFGSAFLIVDVVGYFAEGETPSGGGVNLALGRQALQANTSGFGNTATGYQALRANTTGFFNTASGYEALRSNTTGYRNTASGMTALHENTTGHHNTASGLAALFSNTSGHDNTALGHGAGANTTGDFNTASGSAALYSNAAGQHNTALGYRAGFNTTGNYNLLLDNDGVGAESATIRIGNPNHTRSFLAGVFGVAVANGIPVLIDSAGQLGTTPSSLRFKEDVRDMGASSERLLHLRPVTFRYKQRVRPGEQAREYGLIAEEVAEVFPELAVYGEDGKPETVKYHVLPALLLNELQRMERRLEDQERRLQAQAQEIAELRRERAAAVPPH